MGPPDLSYVLILCPEWAYLIYPVFSYWFRNWPTCSIHCSNIDSVLSCILLFGPIRFIVCSNIGSVLAPPVLSCVLLLVQECARFIYLVSYYCFMKGSSWSLLVFLFDQ